jgi:hypothetical protein
LLSPLSKGQVTQEMKDVTKMTDRLTNELNQMLKEHKEIVTSLQKLTEVAIKENKLEYVVLQKNSHYMHKPKRKCSIQQQS